MSINDIPTNANDNNPEEYYEVFCPEVLLTTWNMLASSLCLVSISIHYYVPIAGA